MSPAWWRFVSCVMQQRNMNSAYSAKCSVFVSQTIIFAINELLKQYDIIPQNNVNTGTKTESRIIHKDIAWKQEKLIYSCMKTK